ncbi:D-lactate dehydrogenase [Rhypophila decipiens]|uniref:D-lactate dehydrogenase (cytochrome) n=1 Tax=Rhypophila decipiens TaxID=261697 RepID=A0AAN6Y9F9_9PEZI|nr:D-lactate dehydrogenase [Rhypophila decipiens]
MISRRILLAKLPKSASYLSARCSPATVPRDARVRRISSTSTRQPQQSHQVPDGRSKGAPSPSVLLGAAVIALAGFTAGMLYSNQSPPKQTPEPSINATKPIYATPAEMLTTARQIESLLGPDCISYEPSDLDHHGHSDWSTSNSPIRGIAIVYPRSTSDVSLICALCSTNRVPVIPYGAGSSVEGNFSQPHSGIILDFTRYMDNIISLNGEDMDVIVQPGVNWVDLNNYIKSQGWNLFAPLDPSPTATIGGMVSTNCSGTNAFRYGTMKDWVVNLTVVLADGRVIKTRKGRPRKTSAGYNLSQLFVGAEGTLGVVTEVTLKLAPVEEDSSVMAVSFGSVEDAAKAAQKLIRSGIRLGALELMDDVQMGILNRHGSERVRRMGRWSEEGATLFVKFSGTTEGIKSDLGRVKELLGSEGDKRSFFFAKNKQDEADIWAARKEALFTMVSIKPEGHEMWSTDVAVPISRLAEIIEYSKKECSKLGIFASVIGHVGDGNFHVAMMYDPKEPGQKEAVGKVVKDMMRKAIDMEGTVSGEHAIGLGKKKYLVEELGEETIGLMKDIKRTLDPKWIMNPGKVFDP